MTDSVIQDECSTCCWQNWETVSYLDCPIHIELIEGTAETFANMQPLKRASVSASGAAGCLTCQILSKACDHIVIRDATPGRWDGKFLQASTLDGEACLHRFGVSVCEKAERFKLFTVPGDLRIPGISVSPKLPSTTYPKHSLPQIRNWISSCVQLHQTCPSAEMYAPPRLLMVKDNNGNDTVRLVEISPTATTSSPDAGNERQPKPSYACLSHRWGESRSKHLTQKANLTTNQVGIPFEELPLTFREAVELARELEIRYLWIDSLCVIQDDPEDWRQHVTEMAETYRNAYVTFAAGASIDDDGGLFREVTPEIAEGTRVRLSRGGKDFSIYFRKSLPHGVPWFGTIGEPLPLTRRGWVLQEYLLSSRLVIFAESELAWACREQSDCSCDPVFLANGHRRGTNPEYQSERMKRAFFQLKTMTLVECLEIWKDLISLYSNLELTFKTDKVAAIAGIAKYFQTEYLSGIWKDALETGDQLTWYTLGERIFPCLGRPRQGPSWTWTSAGDSRKGIRLQWEPDHSLFKILNVIIDRQGRSEFAGITSGCIVIEGILLPVSLEFELDYDNGEGFATSVRELWRVNSWEDGPTTNDTASFSPDFRFAADLRDAEVHLEHARFFLMSCEPAIGDSYQSLEVKGLLLVPRISGPERPAGRLALERYGMLTYVVDPSRTFDSDASSGFPPSEPSDAWSDQTSEDSRNRSSLRAIAHSGVDNASSPAGEDASIHASEGSAHSEEEDGLQWYYELLEDWGGHRIPKTTFDFV